MSYYKGQEPAPKMRPFQRAQEMVDEHVPLFFEPTYERYDFKSYRPVIVFWIFAILLTIGIFGTIFVKGINGYPAMGDNGRPVNAPDIYTDVSSNGTAPPAPKR